MKRYIAPLLSILAVLASGCILHVSHYTDDAGKTVYVGELYSEGNSYGPGATVEGTFYDAGGHVITTEKGSTCLGVDPKHVVPFKVTLPPGTAAPAKVDWQVLATPVADAFLATGLEAQITDQAVDPSGATWFSGLIANNSANTYTGGDVCAAWFNAAGDVLRVAVAEANMLRFAPGNSIPFAMVEQVPPEATTMSFFLDAGVTPPGVTAPTIVDLPSSSYTHALDLTFPLGSGATSHVSFAEIHNTSGSPIGAPRIGAIAPDADGKQLAGLDATCPLEVPAGGFTFGGYTVVGPGTLQFQPTVGIQAQALSSLQETPLASVTVQVQSAGLGNAHVSGSVKNSTTQAFPVVAVCAGVYDAAGKVIGIGFTLIDVPGGVAAGSTHSFSTDVAAFGVPSSVKALAAGAK